MIFTQWHWTFNLDPGLLREPRSQMLVAQAFWENQQTNLGEYGSASASDRVAMELRAYASAEGVCYEASCGADGRYWP